MAVVDQIKPHSHREATKIYEILAGELVVNLEKRRFLAPAGTSFEVKSGEIFSADGNETWIKVIYDPAWSMDDQHQV